MNTRVICVANQKGGVGKTTTAVTLADGLARKGKQVLLIDLDPQGQSATALGLRPEAGAFYLLTMGDSATESAFVRQWLRETGRENLRLMPGDQQTMAAQTVLNAQEKPISAIQQSIRRFTKDDLHYIIFDTAPSVGGIQEAGRVGFRPGDRPHRHRIPVGGWRRQGDPDARHPAKQEAMAGRAPGNFANLFR